MLSLDRSTTLTKHFLPYQVSWIEAEDAFHAQGKQVCALAEKSIRIGWTYCDAFKNVRKRLRFKKRDYLFATKDYPSALEYMKQAFEFAELFDLTGAIISHGEESVKIPRLDDRGRASAFTEEIKVGLIKFDTGSRIIAFSSNPQAMAVYGGDVGLDEFAKHPNARLLWETAQGRVALANDLAVWSAHDGEDTLFYQFAQQARATCGQFASPTLAPADGERAGVRGPCPIEIQNQNSKIQNSPARVRGSDSINPINPFNLFNPVNLPLPSPIEIQNQNSKIQNSPWNLYYRVTMPDALALGLLDVINRARGTRLEPEQFLADCRARAGLEEIYEQSYLCNPVPPAASLVDWSAIERCRHDYQIERLHLDHAQIQKEFGSPAPHLQTARERAIEHFIRHQFPILFSAHRGPDSINPINSVNLFNPINSPLSLRLGFDVAASGHGDLACIYIDAADGSPRPSDGRGVRGEGSAWLRALFTCRTDDWHFLKTVLFTFLRDLPRLQAAGDESGLGRQICWEAQNQFPGKFTPVNFSGRKSDLGFALMNQLASAEKRFPKSHPDIAADFFALRKSFTGTKWLFTEGRNPYNPASHCDIAWAGALASEAHNQKRSNAWAMVG